MAHTMRLCINGAFSRHETLPLQMFLHFVWPYSDVCWKPKFPKSDYRLDILRTCHRCKCLMKHIHIRSLLCLTQRRVSCQFQRLYLLNVWGNVYMCCMHSWQFTLGFTFAKKELVIFDCANGPRVCCLSYDSNDKTTDVHEKLDPTVLPRSPRRLQRK